VKGAHTGEIVEILDFGIAKLMSAATLTGASIIGTPFWLAPEQAAADGGITPATVVWAFGLLAFRMLSGKIYWRTSQHETASVSARAGGDSPQELAAPPRDHAWIDADVDRPSAGGRGIDCADPDWRVAISATIYFGRRRGHALGAR
jgi:serine/threonine protein kinase